MNNGVSKLRKANKSGGNLVLTVPADISRELQGMIGEPFTAELTEEGILFRSIASADLPTLPAWIKEEA